MVGMSRDTAATHWLPSGDNLPGLAVPLSEPFGAGLCHPMVTMPQHASLIAGNSLFSDFLLKSTQFPLFQGIKMNVTSLAGAAM